jgi:hypothetical protein
MFGVFIYDLYPFYFISDFIIHENVVFNPAFMH